MGFGLGAEGLRSALGFVRGLGPWGPALWAGLYVLAAVAFLPAAPLSLCAGALFGLAHGFVVAYAGVWLGAAAGFAVSRGDPRSGWGARAPAKRVGDLARGWAPARLAAHPRWRALDDAVAREGYKAVALARLSLALPYAP